MRILFPYLWITGASVLLSTGALRAQAARDRCIEDFCSGGLPAPLLIVFGLLLAAWAAVSFWRAPLITLKIVFYLVMTLLSLWFGIVALTQIDNGIFRIIIFLLGFWVWWKYVFVGLSEKLESDQEQAQQVVKNWQELQKNSSKNISFIDYIEQRQDLRPNVRKILRSLDRSSL